MEAAHKRSGQDGSFAAVGAPRAEHDPEVMAVDGRGLNHHKVLNDRTLRRW